jgi:hypothetical protein
VKLDFIAFISSINRLTERGCNREKSLVEISRRLGQACGNPALLIGKQYDNLVADANAARRFDFSIFLVILHSVRGYRYIDRRCCARRIRIFGEANNAMFCIALGCFGDIKVAKWFDPQPRQCVKQLGRNLIGVSIEARRETTPEPPADPLQDSLAPHILTPLLGSVKAVTVAFDGQPTALRPFNDHIDPKPREPT